MQAFWREDGYCGAVVTNGGPSILRDCHRGPLCVVFDATSSSGNPALVAFIGGEQQLEYSLKTVSGGSRATSLRECNCLNIHRCEEMC